MAPGSTPGVLGGCRSARRLAEVEPGGSGLVGQCSPSETAGCMKERDGRGGTRPPRRATVPPQAGRGWTWLPVFPALRQRPGHADHTFGCSGAERGCAFHRQQRGESDLSLPTCHLADQWGPSGSVPRGSGSWSSGSGSADPWPVPCVQRSLPQAPAATSLRGTSCRGWQTPSLSPELWAPAMLGLGGPLSPIRDLRSCPGAPHMRPSSQMPHLPKQQANTHLI